VDPVDVSKTTISTGDLWSFYVLPETAGNPNPVDGARNNLTDIDLSWRAGANGDFHHVYFGTDADAVENADKNSPEYLGRTIGTTTTLDPGELQRGMTYYWRVDEAKATGTEWKGTLWQFSTLPVLPILDPDLLGWWKLDEGSGNAAIDWSGQENHGEILYLDGGLGEDGGVWVDDPDKGMVLTFNGDNQTGAVVKAGKIPALGANDDFTWSFWARQQGDGTGEFETILGNRDVGVNHPRFIMFTPTKFEYFVNTGEYTIDHANVNEGLDYPDLEDGIWTHHAIVKDGTDLTYYRNGIETTKSKTTVEQGENAFYMGGDLADGRWSGSMFNVRIYQRALSEEELEIAMRRDPAVAWDPQPAHGRVGDIVEITRLIWNPGVDALEHDVYFGTDAQAVAKATPEDNAHYRGRQTGTEYTPSDLQMGQTYYWRVDEINSDQHVSEGAVWSFTLVDFLIVDDMEFYSNEDDSRIFDAWVDGYENPTGNGALVGADPATNDYSPERTIVHSGKQSLPIHYSNNSAAVSEATRTFADAQDWTAHEVKSLSLMFYGSAEPPGALYVVINNTKLSYPGDVADAARMQWIPFTIDLSTVAGANLQNVTKLTIGIEGPGASGVLYIDDIRLYPNTRMGQE
jgi:hypothetical protein